MKNLALCSAALALVGCALPPLSPPAAKVQIHRQYSTTLDTCKKLGPVTGTITKRFWRPSDGRASVMLREATAQLDGDTVVLLHQDTVGSEVIQHGIAYRCY